MIIPYHDDNPIHRWPVVTVLLIVANVAGFFLLVSYQQNDPHAARLATIMFGFVPRELTNLPARQPVPIDLYPELPPGERPPQAAQRQAPPQDQRYVEIRPTVLGVGISLLTSMFMHANIWHLGGNMLFFWVFGNNIEDRLGHVTFTLFYLAGGVLATLCHWAMAQPPFDTLPMVGASGAVAVMLGAYAVTYPKARIRVLVLLFCVPLFFALPAMVVLGIWILLQVFYAWQAQQGLVTNVALWAHIGGFAVGALIMPLLAAITPAPEEDAAGHRIGSRTACGEPNSSGIERDDDFR